MLARIEKAFSSLSEYPERGNYPTELLDIGIREYRDTSPPVSSSLVINPIRRRIVALSLNRIYQYGGRNHCEGFIALIQGYEDYILYRLRFGKSLT